MNGFVNEQDQFANDVPESGVPVYVEAIVFQDRAFTRFALVLARMRSTRSMRMLIIRWFVELCDRVGLPWENA